MQSQEKKKNCHADKKGSVGHCSQNKEFCEAKPVATALFDENMKESSNR